MDLRRVLRRVNRVQRLHGERCGLRVGVGVDYATCRRRAGDETAAWGLVIDQHRGKIRRAVGACPLAGSRIKIDARYGRRPHGTGQSEYVVRGKAGIRGIQTFQHTVHDAVGNGSLASLMGGNRQLGQVPSYHFRIGRTRGEEPVYILRNVVVITLAIGAGRQLAPQLVGDKIGILRITRNSRQFDQKQRVLCSEPVVTIVEVHGRHATVHHAITVGDRCIQVRRITSAFVNSQQTKCRGTLRVDSSGTTRCPGEGARRRTGAVKLLGNQPRPHCH